MDHSAAVRVGTEVELSGSMAYLVNSTTAGVSASNTCSIWSTAKCVASSPVAVGVARARRPRKCWSSRCATSPMVITQLVNDSSTGGFRILSRHNMAEITSRGAAQGDRRRETRVDHLLALDLDLGQNSLHIAAASHSSERSTWYKKGDCTQKKSRMRASFSYSLRRSCRYSCCELNPARGATRTARPSSCAGTARLPLPTAAAPRSSRAGATTSRLRHAPHPVWAARQATPAPGDGGCIGRSVSTARREHLVPPNLG
jgi:hypothetical protein